MTLTERLARARSENDEIGEIRVPATITNSPSLSISEHAILISRLCASIWDAQRQYADAKAHTVGEYLDLAGAIAAGQLAAAQALAGE